MQVSPRNVQVIMICYSENQPSFMAICCGHAGTIAYVMHVLYSQARVHCSYRLSISKDLETKILTLLLTITISSDKLHFAFVLQIGTIPTAVNSLESTT